MTQQTTTSAATVAAPNLSALREGTCASAKSIRAAIAAGEDPYTVAALSGRTTPATKN